MRYLAFGMALASAAILRVARSTVAAHRERARLRRWR
jgi:hypothetical protein